MLHIQSKSDGKSLKGPELKEHLQRLRQTDNITNWYYLLRTWAYLAVVIGTTVWFYQYRATADLSFWWNVPVTILAILMVGAGQHQLTGLAHEASHHTLFNHRYLNDLASDWFCMFPLFSSTHHYRLQHMAHHQFVNDPERDPDISQLKTSGHWLDFPISKLTFVATLLKQLWIPNLIRYMRIRAKYNAIPTDKNPYVKKDWKPNKVTVRVGIAYIVGMIGLLAGLVHHGDPILLAALPAVAWVAMLVFYGRLPEKMYHQSRVHPVISSRHMTQMRLTFVTILFSTLAWVQFETGVWAGAYFLLLWAVPIFTSFSFFMILRQIVQHGNGGRGWLTNTRTFFVHKMINFAVFPMGQDYHLPHHLFATIPHYRLKELHAVLMQFPEYQKEAVVVEGYFLPHGDHRHPTVLEVLGPDHVPPEFLDIYIDNSVLELDEVEDKAEILNQGEQEKRKWAEIHAKGA